MRPLPLVEALFGLGIEAGMVVMVHASMRAVGGRAERLIEALQAAVGEAGSLLVYLDFEETPSQPFFDPLRSPAARDHGVFAEVFRTWPGVQISTNPGARMAAWGARAHRLVAEHPLRDGYGPGSPLAKLVEADGQVLLLGSDLDHVTLLHHAESLARLPNKRWIQATHRLADGRSVVVEEFDSEHGVVAGMPDRYFASCVQAFLAAGLGHTGVVGGATSHRMSASALLRFAVERMERDFGSPG